METILTDSPETAAEYIRNGGIVAFPTETVYGLGGNVFDESAIARIFAAKMRPADNPLIAHVSERSQIPGLCDALTDDAERFIEAFFPGPLTVVVKRTERVPDIATAGLDTIGIRMPRLETARRFIAACGLPVAAPSANLSGRPSPTTWQAVHEDLNGRIDCILTSESTEIGLESTVVDCSADRPVLLRLGSLSLEQLQEIVPATRAFEAAEITAPRSPGMRHKHYSPRAKVVIVGSPDDTFINGREAAFIGMQATGGDLKLQRICKDVDEYARVVFEFFRECDRQGVETIFCAAVAESGIGAALMDRLRRAANS